MYTKYIDVNYSNACLFCILIRICMTCNIFKKCFDCLTKIL